MSVNFSKSLPRAVQLAHEIVSSRIAPGDTAVDATLGNGHDTLFLAKLVGQRGRVIGFDIQKAALESTREKIPEGVSVDLHLESHSRMSDLISDPVAAVMFNLGYLPSADKSVITSAESTVPALEAAAGLLKPGGVITVVAYTGHTGGPEEQGSVQQWCECLPQSDFTVAHYAFLNQANNPPELFAIEKK